MKVWLYGDVMSECTHPSYCVADKHLHRRALQLSDGSPSLRRQDAQRLKVRGPRRFGHRIQSSFAFRHLFARKSVAACFTGV